MARARRITASVCKVWALLALACIAVPCAMAQEIPFDPPQPVDEASLEGAIPTLAKRLLAFYGSGNTPADPRDLFWAQLAAGEYSQAHATARAWRASSKSTEEQASILPLELHAQSESAATADNTPLDEAFRRSFRAHFKALDDKTAHASMASFAPPPLASMREQLQGTLGLYKEKDRIAASEALDLCRRYALIRGYQAIAPLTEALIAEDHANRYVIDDDALIKTPEGVTINAIIVRPRLVQKRLPAALQFTIYPYPWTSSSAIEAAANGYVGVVGFSRGKRHSPDAVVPYEHDGDDARALIDWISRQPWSDGRVGMYGGSYNGFTQWAAVKRLPAALKTIVPYCPNDPGFGLPMTNNVFLTANYAWAFYAASGKDLDDQIYSDAKRWHDLSWNWYRSGRPFRKIDRVDGKPNPWLQRWLDHPAYDAYWQGMTANGKDYRKLDIPVLAIDGYFDDGQNNAVRRLLEHYNHRPDAEHYLVIGPYDHFGTQGPAKQPVLRGYSIDPVAHLNTVELTFQWFDYIFKGAAKPAILKDRINYQVMGANTWKHAPSIEKMSDEALKLYLTDTPVDDFYRLATRPLAAAGALKMTVDFKDRTTLSANTYPGRIITRDLMRSSGLVFISDPLDAPLAVSGLFSATLNVVLNKKDADIAIVLYEAMPSGEYFHLSSTVMRASHAKDMTRRHLLTPNQRSTIVLDKTLLVSRQLSKGSRLLVVLDVNKGPFAQVNYGTGKDVSDESIADAAEPLQIEWLPGSYVQVPVLSR